MNTISKILLLFIGLISFVKADIYDKNGGGFINGEFGDIGTYDPKYDSLYFTPRTEVNLYFEGNIRISDPFYSIWKDITFNDPTAPDRMSVHLLGTNLSLTSNLNGGFVRTMQTSQLTLNKVDLDSFSVKILFLGNNNRLTLNDSNMDLSFVDMAALASAPMTVNVTGGSNKITAWDGNISPSKFTLNIANGASLELFASGDVYTTTPSQRLNIDTTVEGSIDGGSLILKDSNAYFKSNENFEFKNNATLQLLGSKTLFEVEHVKFQDSKIQLGRNTVFQINQVINLEDSELVFGEGSQLQANDVIKTKGTIHLSGASSGSGIRGASLLDMNSLGGSTQFTQEGITASKVEFLIMKSGSTLDLANTDFEVNEQFFASDNAQVNIHDNASFLLNGTVAGISSIVDFNIDYGGKLIVTQSGTLVQRSSSNFDNDGVMLIEGYYGANGAVTGSGDIIISEDGIMDFGNKDNSVFTFSTDNNIYFEPDPTNLAPSADGGTLNVQLDVSGGSATNDTIQYGAGNVVLTKMGKINVGLTKTLTADELDGQSFTLIEAQSSGVSGTLIDAATTHLAEGADIPALIDFTISDNNTNGKPDLTLNAQKLGSLSLATHPSVVDRHRPATISSKTPHPSLPGHTITTTTNVTPTSNGGATQTTTTVVTNAGGSSVSSSTGTSTLAPATGSPNKSSGATLVTTAANNGNTQINNALNSLTNQQVASHFDTIHPEGYSSYMTVGLEASLLALETVNSSTRGNTFRAPVSMASLDDLPPVKGDYQKEFWLDLNYANGSIDEDGELGSIDYSITSFLFGQDLVVDHNSKLGVFSGYSHYKMDEHGISDLNLDTDALYLGVYGQYTHNDWIFNSTLGYAYGMNESERDSTLGTISGTSEADYDSHSFFIGSSAQTAIYTNQLFTLSPELGLYYVYYYQEEFDESGNSSLDLSLDSADAHSLVNTIGFNIQFADLGDTYAISPLVYFRYEYDWITDNNDDHSIQASLKNSNSGKQSFSGQNRGANHLVSGFSISAQVTDNTELNFGSSYTYSDNGDEYGLNARFIYSF
ncbi:autotransporter domain-containing protein [Lentisphaera profundi]|uniref:Autotransporter domain-containing protein n=1 Tax=Lentisphaera profundi TaxID=1658616 RepID=A0ABY7VXI7_9BACT|nr:autotransporter outer membrane beta-barrel domain-containing protein [Lentisphaera profundi]WDE98509.1 autotransporter domain-containing protein [Lentisphaera profundi]